MSSRIGELLVRLGYLSTDQLQEAEQTQQQMGCHLSSAVVKMGLLSEQQLLEIFSQQYGLTIVNLEEYQVDHEVVSLIPQQLAVKHQLAPIELAENTMSIAMVDPSNILALNDIKFITGYDIQVLLTSETQLRTFIDKLYEGNVSYDTIMEDFSEEPDVEVMGTDDELDVNALEKATEDAPVVKLVNAILTDGIKKGASDIHIEPYEKSFRVRFRIDGVLYEIMKPPLKLKNAITSRIKIMAELDIAERRLPQDGRIKLKMKNRKEMDFRVSVLPSLFGEKVVLRLLDKSNLQTDMRKLGFNERQLDLFQAAITKPYGMVLVTGPTGSGKTTSLYSALAELNKTVVNISTAEDPVEFNLPGINQVQVHDDIGLNFAAALRSFLRQDPDIIMVGEVRDYETAEIAIKASLTGHLVLSTLHTNDAPSTVNRLLNMGVEPFLVASSINIIVAQRLARRICDGCKELLHVTPESLVDIGLSSVEAKSLQVYHGTGCKKCSGTGYRGRIALYECMPMTEELKEYVLNGASAIEIKKAAIQQGMKTLRSSGLDYLKEGITSIEEVLRVTVSDN
ncbi:MAG: type IV-A pilus assembly ATPase PilB [Deltaproteobacteria bacterium]|nr:type IV-A pilus assembly ATPase PilB [Deltaproteobacteria bacterium]